MKKIIVFSCIGGHNIVSHALQEHLKSSYTVCVKNIFADVLKRIDFISTVTAGCYSSEDLYSYALQKQWHTFLNTFVIRMGYCFFSLQKTKIFTLIFNDINTEKPDIIISVVPFFNQHFFEAARLLNIPFILIPTDVDLTTFLYKMDTIFYDKFRIILPVVLDKNIIKKQLYSLAVQPDQISVSGAVLKSDFFKPYSISCIKKKFNISQNVPVVLLLMGSQGSASLHSFAQELSTITNLSFHLIIITGKNSVQKRKIASLSFPSHITTTLFGFTACVAELMAISDLLVTKSGGVSICEALYMNLPLLLDATTEVLLWEKLNQEFIVKNNFGTTFTSTHCLKKHIVHLLTNQDSLTLYKQNSMHFVKKNGALHIKNIVDELLIE